MLFSINCFGINGNELHRLLNSEDMDERNYAKYYIMAAVDGINYYKATEISIAKLEKRKPDLRFFICTGKVIYNQSFDVVKNYLSNHPEIRNESAIDLASLALFEAWPCTNN